MLSVVAPPIALYQVSATYCLKVKGDSNKGHGLGEARLTQDHGDPVRGPVIVEHNRNTDGNYEQ